MGPWALVETRAIAAATAANRAILVRSQVLVGLLLEGPTRKPRHASVFSTHSDTQAVPAFHCIRMFKGIFSTRAFLKRTDTLSSIT